jgi:branched-subunit amino acid ABC-type transport system permease component
MVFFLNGVSAIALLLIASSGLDLILGFMGVINLAHPGLMALGGYGALVASQYLPVWPSMLLGAGLATVVGMLIEWLIVKRLYRRPLDTILATWGIALVIWQGLILIFGRVAYPFDGPVSGFISMGGFSYSAYRLLLIGIAFLLVVALGVISRYTRVGLIARAVMANGDLAAGLGLNTRAVQRCTFAIGVFMAGAAGALIAPLAPVQPFMGLSYLIPAFLVVLLAGKTVSGLVLGAVLIAGGQTAVSLFVNPIVASVFVVLIAVLLLRFFPGGFERLWGA